MWFNRMVFTRGLETHQNAILLMLFFYLFFFSFMECCICRHITAVLSLTLRNVTP